MLASGDHQGNAALWSLDTHCKLCLLAAFKAAPTGPISALLFHELAAIPALFYSVTTDTGTDVYLGDSKQDHSNLYSVPSPTALLGLFWCDVSSQLVTVAASGELFVHGTNAQAPDKWDLVVKLRIGAGVKSAAADSKLMVAWVAGHTLASASGQDGTIRMYNLETEDNYVLQIGRSIGSLSPFCLSTGANAAVAEDLADF